jgi:uncharacterized phage-like protein YoqJ
VILAFTGHRPDKLGGWDPLHPIVVRVRKALRNALAANWPLYAISGMAQGVDVWAAEVCVELGIPFVAALPCDGWGTNWPLPSQERYQALLCKAKEIHVISPGEYKPWKMQRRNEWMVDHCNLLLSVWDGSPGGTYNCLAYAAEVGRETKQLEWRTMSVDESTLRS